MATIGDVYEANRRRLMAGRGTAGIGGPAGSVPIGDRPGTTSITSGQRAWNTPAGRAHVFALGAFALLVFLNIAAENRER